jgi:hypothetical protein
MGQASASSLQILFSSLLARLFLFSRFSLAESFRPFWLSSDVLSSEPESSLGLELLLSEESLLSLSLGSGELLGSRLFLFFLGFFRLRSSLLRLRRLPPALLSARRFCRP